MGTPFVAELYPNLTW